MNRIDSQDAVLESSRLRILQAILATQSGSLTIPEIAYRVQRSESEVHAFLEEMMARERPFVVALEVPVENREPGIPSTFYAATEYAMELLKDVGMYDAITILYQVYERMEDRPEEVEAIREFEHRPSPHWL